METFWYRPTQVNLEKWPIKMEREEAIFHTNKIDLMREYLSGVQ